MLTPQSPNPHHMQILIELACVKMQAPNANGWVQRWHGQTQPTSVPNSSLTKPPWLGLAS